MVFSTFTSKHSLRCFFKRLLVFAAITAIPVTSSPCDNITITWLTNSIPWRITHEPFQDSETIVSLPNLTQSKLDGLCNMHSFKYECLNCIQGVLIDN